MKHRNTREGYEVEGAETLPDDFDHGLGYAAGTRVRIAEEHEIYPGEEGEIYAVARGQGWHGGSYVVDVLIDGTSEPHRFEPDEIAETL